MKFNVRESAVLIIFLSSNRYEAKRETSNRTNKNMNLTEECVCTPICLHVALI